MPKGQSPKQTIKRVFKFKSPEKSTLKNNDSLSKKPKSLKIKSKSKTKISSPPKSPGSNSNNSIDPFNSPNNRSGNWVSVYMGDQNYNIVETVRQGDCFFDAVRIATGISIKELRQHLVTNLNQTIFDNFKELYDSSKSYQNSDDITELLQYVEFEFMKGIKTMKQLEEMLMKSKFWANSWAISVLEKELNIKFIIMDELKYNHSQLTQIITCGEHLPDAVNGPTCTLCGVSLNNPDLSKIEEYKRKHESLGKDEHQWLDSNSKITEFKADKYIIVSYNDNHYKLVTYNDSPLLDFDDLSRALIDKIKDTCIDDKKLSRFALIPQFTS